MDKEKMKKNSMLVGATALALTGLLGSLSQSHSNAVNPNASLQHKIKDGVQFASMFAPKNKLKDGVRLASLFQPMNSRKNTA